MLTFSRLKHTSYLDSRQLFCLLQSNVRQQERVQITFYRPLGLTPAGIAGHLMAALKLFLSRPLQG